MPDFTLADILGAQAGAPGPVYEGGPTGNVTPGDLLTYLYGLGRKGAQADVNLTQGIKDTATNAVLAPGRAATGAYNVTPEVPGQYSDVDEARRQLNEAHANRSIFDLSAGMIGAPAPAEGASLRSGLELFSERMQALKDAAFERAQRGTATGDYGLGTARRTEPPPPKGSMEDASDRLMSSLRDTQRQLAEYKNPPAKPILAPGETDVSFFSGGNKKVGAALAAAKATTEMTPIGEQYVLPGAERASEATMVQRAADAPLKAEVPQKPMDVGLFGDESKQGSLFSGGNKRAGTLLALAKGEQPAPYDFLTGRRPDAPYPQFAERYPDIGQPTPKPKDKPSYPGETYPAKTLTPEAEQFAKTREKITKQMEKEGYEPFFDPSQRFPAEWEKQPGPHVDTAQAVAKKQETIDRHLATIGAEETRKRFREGYSRGLDLPDSQAWYLMGQVEKKMVQDMGEEAGRKHFRDSIATAMSATTTGQTPKTNLIMAQYLNYLKKTRQPFPTEAHMTPVTVGGQRVMPNIEAYQEIMGEGGGYHALGLENPKRTDFAQAQMGNPNAYTFDEQMSHATLGKDVPAGGTYGLATTVGREEAARAGVIPQRHQDVTWAGFKKMLEEEGRAKKGFRPYGEGEGYQGKPLIAEVNDMIERTHRITGMPRQEIWTRGFIKNEIPLYSGGSPTLGGVLLGQTQEPPAR